MSTDTEKLEREVESRRSTVESTIEELRSRMSVGQIMDEVSGYLKEGQASAMAQNLGRQVRDNPIALGLIGAGMAWLLMGDGVRDSGRRIAGRLGDWQDDDDRASGAMGYRGTVGGDRSAYPSDFSADMTDDLYSDTDERRYARSMPYTTGGSGQVDYDGMPITRTGSSSEGESLAGRASSSASGMMDSLAEGASSAASGISSAVSSAASRLGEAASSVGGSARRYGHDAADAAWRAERAAMSGARYAGRGATNLGLRAQRGFVDTLQQEPLIMGAIAVAIGAAIGASLPSTRVEDEYLGDARDRLRDQAVDYGKDALDSAKNVAEETYRAASAEADKKGLTPSGDGETLAEKVSGVLKTATETAKSEAKKEGLV